MYLIGQLISYFIGPDSSTTTADPVLGYIYAVALAVCYITITLLAHPTFHTNYILGMKMRVACTSLMYRKVRVTIATEKFTADRITTAFL